MAETNFSTVLNKFLDKGKTNIGNFISELEVTLNLPSKAKFYLNSGISEGAYRRAISESIAPSNTIKDSKSFNELLNKLEEKYNLSTGEVVKLWHLTYGYKKKRSFDSNSSLNEVRLNDLPESESFVRYFYNLSCDYSNKLENSNLTYKERKQLGISLYNELLDFSGLSLNKLEELSGVGIHSLNKYTDSKKETREFFINIPKIVKSIIPSQYTWLQEKLIDNIFGIHRKLSDFELISCARDHFYKVESDQFKADLPTAIYYKRINLRMLLSDFAEVCGCDQETLRSLENREIVNVSEHSTTMAIVKGLSFSKDRTASPVLTDFLFDFCKCGVTKNRDFQGVKDAVDAAYKEGVSSGVLLKKIMEHLGETSHSLSLKLKSKGVKIFDSAIIKLKNDHRMQNEESARNFGSALDLFDKDWLEKFVKVMMHKTPYPNLHEILDEDDNNDTSILKTIRHNKSYMEVANTLNVHETTYMLMESRGIISVSKGANLESLFQLLGINDDLYKKKFISKFIQYKDTNRVLKFSRNDNGIT